MLLRNAIKTPDGTVIESRHVHDFVSYRDANGHVYSVDGGTDYARRLFDEPDYEDLCIEDTGDLMLAREHLSWGTYGKPEDWAEGVCPQMRRVLIKDMSNAHIGAIMEDVANNKQGLAPQYLRYFNKELEYREENNIVIED